MIGAAAFVAGVAALQLQSVLPSRGVLLASALLGTLLTAWAVIRRGHRAETLVVLTAVAGLALGFAYAGGRAHFRLADEL